MLPPSASMRLIDALMLFLVECSLSNSFTVFFFTVFLLPRKTPGALLVVLIAFQPSLIRAFRGVLGPSLVEFYLIRCAVVTVVIVRADTLPCWVRYATVCDANHDAPPTATRRSH